MKNINKIFKWLMWALIIVSVVLLLWGFGKGYPASVGEGNDGTVNALLYWAYIMVGIAIFCVVVFGIAIAAVNNPKSLIKLLIGIVAAAVIVLICYLIAPASPAVGLTTEQPSHAVLKMTDTLMILTYVLGALAVLAIIVGEIVSAVRNK